MRSASRFFAIFTAAAVGCSALVAADQVGFATEVEKLQARVLQLETEMRSLRERLEKLEASRPANTPATSEIKITIIPGGWGNSGLEDIAAVCRSAEQELTRHMSDRNKDPISVRHDANQGPMVIYGKGADGERRVLLSSQDRRWSQFAFQFAHEVCHIQCNYRDREKSNLWFEESLCETASLFVLKQMAETWKTNPPYANWKSYSDSLRQYAEDRNADLEKPDDVSLAEWFRKNEAEMRQSAIDRRKTQVFAAALLPLFEKNPQHWRAIRFLNLGDPQATLTFTQYLRDWHERVPSEHRSFVEQVAALFEVAVK